MRHLLLAAIPAVALAGCAGYAQPDRAAPAAVAPPSYQQPPVGVYPPWANDEWWRIMRGEPRNSAYAPPPDQPDIPDKSAPDDAEPQPPRRHHQQPPAQEAGPVVAPPRRPSPPRPPSPADGPECVGWWRLCHAFF